MEVSSNSFEARSDVLRGRGFAIQTPTGEFASERMILLEQLAERAADIRAKILDLPKYCSEERDTFLKQIENPENVGDVELEFQKFLRQRRPWILIAERVRGDWSEEGRSTELDRILRRLELLDESLVLASPRISEMIEDVAPWREIEPLLKELELRSNRRIDAMDGMMEMLKMRGWDVTRLSQGAMHERFAEADFLYQLDSRLEICQKQIEVEIRPYDSRLAERLWRATVIAQRGADVESMVDIENEIKDVSSNLSLRLAIVEERISEWKNDGFKIGISIPLLPREMIEWEGKLPAITEQVEASLAIWAQLEGHLVQWPEYRQLAERTRGYLDAIDALSVLLEGLEAKTDGAVAECQARLEAWNSYGIDTTHWGPLIDGEPRAVLEELEIHKSLIDLIIPLIQELELIDTSLGGEVDVNTWLQHLRNSSAGVTQIEGARSWLDVAVKRIQRHREHLDIARIELATLWPAGVDPESLNLKEYENMISDLEAGTFQYSGGRENIVAEESNIERVKRGFESELDAWSLLGWTVDGLRELLRQDPVRLGLDLPTIRAAMKEHDSRISRFNPLPWGLNIDLAERVLSDLARPERLPGLDDDFATIVKQLSAGGEREDPDFVFNPFRPSLPRAKIVKRIPVLIPERDNEVLIEVEAEEQEFVQENIEVNESAPLENVISSTEESISEIDMSLEVNTNKLFDIFAVNDVELVNPANIKLPLDVRVQRLLRISWIVSQSNIEVQNILFEKLEKVGNYLNKWISERLSQRNASSNKGLLMNAYQLAEKLSEIPGPGTAIPMSKDLVSLPEINDLSGLSSAVRRLEKSIRLPSARISVIEVEG